MSIYFNNYELTKKSVWSFFSGCGKIRFNYYSLDQNYQISEESIGSEPCQRKNSRIIWNSKHLKSSYIDYVDFVILKQFIGNGLKQWYIGKGRYDFVTSLLSQDNTLLGQCQPQYYELSTKKQWNDNVLNSTVHCSAHLQL